MLEDKKKILQELGDIPEETYDELVRFFIKQLKENIPKIKAALANRDFDTLARLAHSLKGSSGNLRIHQVYELTVQINDMAKSAAAAELISAKLADLEILLPVLEQGIGLKK
jgi:HPt (histidine-containing phosphotransfer) domain-containing protein